MITSYIIISGKHSYSFTTEIPKSVLSIFVEKAIKEAEYIYQNWHRGASKIYGGVIRVNSSNYISIYQAGMPNGESLDEWVKQTALNQAHEFVNALSQMSVHQNNA